MSLPDAFKDIAASEKPRKVRKCEPESWVKEQVKKAVKTFCPDAWGFMPVQGPEGEHGIPDHLYGIPVRITEAMVGQKVCLLVGIEDKADDGVVSALQKNCHTRMRSASAIVWIVRGRDGVADLKAKLQALTHVGS
jgi:hypothetical protein